eukprot:CAMPEP_0116026868 /NCGR_PEP_ID=MMETSP0321-20121206/14202_1 /TAXON_ID=163516 /ORGANISM="Leptocylindrus danicus var. danicus, Strain B650" /LENGTH=691 /DNA_ID=CAMNT_0003499939 /DNA_START=164 /DNA_END=2239 /DNA_ORIENTATION=-
MMQNNRKRNAISNNNNNSNPHMPAKKLCKKRFEEQTEEQHIQTQSGETAESTTAINVNKSSTCAPILVQTSTRLSPSPIQLYTNTNASTRLQQQTIVSPIVPNATMSSSYEGEESDTRRQAREHNADSSGVVTLPELLSGAKHEAADLNSCVAAHNLLQLTRSMSPPTQLTLQRRSQASDVTTKTCNIQKKIKKTATEATQRQTQTHLNDYDVLCGRGAGTSNRPGNINYRNLIQRYSVAYRAASSTVDKNRIATGIVEEIQQRGRFMKKVSSRTAAAAEADYDVVFTLTFKEIEDKVAVEKTCQALRDASSISSAASTPARKPLSLQAASHYPRMTTTTSADESSSCITKPISCDHMDMINENDVLLGRGGFTNNHTGNRRFRQLVQQYQLQYFHASKMEKPAIASMIVHTIRSSNPPGRFLKKSKMDEVTTRTDADDDSVSSGGSSWKDVGDLRAREKVSQALREKAPELKAMYTTAKSLADLNVSPNPPAAEQGEVPSDASCTWVELPRAAILKNYGGATATGATESVRSVSPHPTATALNSPNHHLPSIQALANQIHVVGEHDVLCGRGAGVNNHPGNQRFRELVKMNRGDYKKTKSKKAKSEIAKSIVATIYDNGGRFLKKVTQRSEDDECVWMDVGTQKANEKTSQALREGHTLSEGARSKQANASSNASSGQSLRIRVPLSYVC